MFSLRGVVKVKGRLERCEKKGLPGLLCAPLAESDGREWARGPLGWRPGRWGPSAGSERGPMSQGQGAEPRIFVPFHTHPEEGAQCLFK